MIKALLVFFDIEALMEDGKIRRHDGRWKNTKTRWKMEEGIMKIGNHDPDV